MFAVVVLSVVVKLVLAILLVAKLVLGQVLLVSAGKGKFLEVDDELFIFRLIF